ncbi:hypothetical protein [Burkholderia oklahomensis]|uniref:hypothetical protein n=2 Tax=Burkholderia oklahomensis TaxID=342113 RepID=UPI000F53727A|nr:hypothetical protein [Burkholderia oklahomensis]MBI0362455.1 hypothetical protein [Burkholderia oklahomensis]
MKLARCPSVECIYSLGHAISVFKSIKKSKRGGMGFSYASDDVAVIRFASGMQGRSMRASDRSPIRTDRYAATNREHEAGQKLGFMLDETELERRRSMRSETPLPSTQRPSFTVADIRLVRSSRCAYVKLIALQLHK